MINYIIAYKNEYWTGYTFSRVQDQAQEYKSKNEAWKTADNRFSEDVAEECYLLKVQK